MKPRKILSDSARVALASFGQMLLREGAVWAVQKMGRRKGKRGRKKVNPTVAALVTEGTRFLETQWDAWMRSKAAYAAARRSEANGRSSVADDGEGDRAQGKAERPARRRAKRKRSARA